MGSCLAGARNIEEKLVGRQQLWEATFSAQLDPIPIIRADVNLLQNQTQEIIAIVNRIEAKSDCWWSNQRDQVSQQQQQQQKQQQHIEQQQQTRGSRRKSKRKSKKEKQEFQLSRSCGNLHAPAFTNLTEGGYEIPVLSHYEHMDEIHL